MTLNHHLLPILRALTDHHCAYCDALVPEGLAESIDHFRPKACSHFPDLAYEWTNLFLACGTCQRAKLDQVSEHLIKPDDPSYDFDRYFTYRVRNGLIEPREGLSQDAALRARETIRILGLNDNGHPAARVRELKKRQKADAELAPDEWPYRFTW